MPSNWVQVIKMTHPIWRGGRNDHQHREKLTKSLEKSWKKGI